MPDDAKTPKPEEIQLDEAPAPDPMVEAMGTAAVEHFVRGVQSEADRIKHDFVTRLKASLPAEDFTLLGRIMSDQEKRVRDAQARVEARPLELVELRHKVQNLLVENQNLRNAGIGR